MVEKRETAEVIDYTEIINIIDQVMNDYKRLNKKLSIITKSVDFYRDHDKRSKDEKSYKIKC